MASNMNGEPILISATVVSNNDDLPPKYEEVDTEKSSVTLTFDNGTCKLWKES